jgi:peptidyl-prolyl cis-trans isomerase A (cyclophilin A)
MTNRHFTQNPQIAPVEIAHSTPSAKSRGIGVARKCPSGDDRSPLADRKNLEFFVGRRTVSQSWKPIVACLSLLLFVAAGGCSGGGANGGDGKKSPATAGDGTKKNDPPEGAAQASPTPQANPDLDHPVVEIETSKGTITVELDRKNAVNTVDNFLTYVKDNFYNRTIVHQVFKDQAIVAGGYDTNLAAKAGRTPVFNEAANNLKNLRGTIAMSRWPDSIDSATSQFFINVADNKALDYKDRTPQGYGYCVFGKVTKGMEVVDAINATELRDTTTLERTPAVPIIVMSIRRIR